jgi:CheY-like chemotaxis protein
MDGYEAIAKLRRNFTLSTLPVFVLTAEEGPGVEDAGCNGGPTTSCEAFRPSRPEIARQRRVPAAQDAGVVTVGVIG